MHCYLNSTHRCSDFGVGRVFGEKLLLDRSFLLGVTRGEDVVDIVELADVEVGVEGVKLPELLQVGLGVASSVDTRRDGLVHVDDDRSFRGLAAKREDHSDGVKIGINGKFEVDND